MAKRINRYNEIRGEIERYLARTGKSKTQLAKKLGMSLPTFYTKYKDPNRFTLGEFILLMDITKTDDATKLILIS